MTENNFDKYADMKKALQLKISRNTVSEFLLFQIILWAKH